MKQVGHVILHREFLASDFSRLCLQREEILSNPLSMQNVQRKLTNKCSRARTGSTPQLRQTDTDWRALQGLTQVLFPTYSRELNQPEHFAKWVKLCDVCCHLQLILIWSDQVFTNRCKDQTLVHPQHCKALWWSRTISPQPLSPNTRVASPTPYTNACTTLCS